MVASMSHSPEVPQFARKVLIVEDDAVVLDTLACVLMLQGYIVLRARTLADARAAMIRQPDFVFADVTLPDGSGWELLRRLRRRGADVVVAAVVADGDAAARELAPLRPDVIFSKPIDLRSVLAWLVDGVHATAAGANAPPAEPVAAFRSR